MVWELHIILLLVLACLEKTLAVSGKSTLFAYGMQSLSVTCDKRCVYTCVVVNEKFACFIMFKSKQVISNAPNYGYFVQVIRLPNLRYYLRKRRSRIIINIQAIIFNSCFECTGPVAVSHCPMF